jgi:iron complex transport system ATP-binding protein
MRLLAERGYEVSAGVLHGGDTDEMVAERLGLLRVSVPPFSVVDDRAVADCLEVIRAADLLVVCDPPVGPGNVANLRMCLDAVRAGIRTVLLEQTPIGERDFTGGEASALWAELVRLAPVVPSMEALDELIRALRPEVGSTPG